MTSQPAAEQRPATVVSGCLRPHALVTGTSSGIGRATALRLAALGYHVFAGVRREIDAAHLPAHSPGSLTPVRLDITDSGQLAAAASLVENHTAGAGLRVLVNNAGIGVTWPLELVPLALFRQQLEVNVTGQLAAIQALLPAVRRAGGTIIVIGSIGDRLTLPFAGPLTASKSAVAALTGSLRQELAPNGVKVVLVEPASIRSVAADKLGRNAQHTLASFSPGGRALYGQPYAAMTAAAVRREHHGSDPAVVADTIARAVRARRPAPRYLVGKHAYLLAFAALLPTRLLDVARRRALGLQPVRRSDRP